VPTTIPVTFSDGRAIPLGNCTIDDLAAFQEDTGRPGIMQDAEIDALTGELVRSGHERVADLGAEALLHWQYALGLAAD
jgi:hypothetical protein